MAPNVHDFSWAADTEYVHDIVDVPGGPKMHFFYKEDDNYSENWKIVQPYSVMFMQYFIENIPCTHNPRVVQGGCAWALGGVFWRMFEEVSNGFSYSFGVCWGGLLEDF